MSSKTWKGLILYKEYLSYIFTLTLSQYNLKSGEKKKRKLQRTQKNQTSEAFILYKYHKLSGGLLIFKETTHFKSNNLIERCISTIVYIIIQKYYLCKAKFTKLIISEGKLITPTLTWGSCIPN